MSQRICSRWIQLSQMLPLSFILPESINEVLITTSIKSPSRLPASTLPYFFFLFIFFTFFLTLFFSFSFSSFSSVSRPFSSCISCSLSSLPLLLSLFLSLSVSFSQSIYVSLFFLSRCPSLNHCAMRIPFSRNRGTMSG